jgi:hypothetical protein
MNATNIAAVAAGVVAIIGAVFAGLKLLINGRLKQSNPRPPDVP